MKKTVITYGTFDMFHVGHLNLLRRLTQLGGRLIVAVSTDEFNAVKGKRCLIPYEQRAAIVQAIKGVDLVIPERDWNQKSDDIRNYDADIFAIGEDWKGKFDDLSELCEVIYLPRTPDVSTTELKRSLRGFLSIPRNDLMRAFEIMEVLRRDLE